MMNATMPAAERSCNLDPHLLDPMVNAAKHSGIDSLTQRLVEIKQWLEDDLKTLERELSGCFELGGDLAQRAAGHLVKQPGKRIRPLCILLAARLGGCAFDHTIRQLALACEMVHSATLLHDDVLDEGMERRGVETSRVVFGNSASVLGGDYLLIDALRRVRGTGQHRALAELMDVVALMVEAEAIQLERRGRFEPSRSVYMKIIYGKTASIFEWGLRSGALAAGMTEELALCLSRVGKNVGLAFQLVDDALDLSGDARTTGKDMLNDIKEGKVTWPLIVASERDPYVAEQLTRVALDPGLLTPEFQRDLRSCMLATGCVDATHQRAMQFAQEAETALLRLPCGSARDALGTVVQSVINRSF